MTQFFITRKTLNVWRIEDRTTGKLVAFATSYREALAKVQHLISY